MARTITALFDTRADAEAGRDRLKQSGIDASGVHIHDETTHRTTGDYSTREDRGLWGSVNNSLAPDADRHTYEEGIRRGGFLLTADIDDASTPAAVRALEDVNSVDLDERAQQWRSQGWDHTPATDTLQDDTPGAIRDADYDSTRSRSYSSTTR